MIRIPKQNKEDLVLFMLEREKKDYGLALLSHFFGCGRLYTQEYGLRFMFVVVFILVPFVGAVRRFIDFFLLYRRVDSMNKENEKYIRRKIDYILYK